MRRDPALDFFIETPRVYWRPRVRLAVPLVGWVGLAFWALAHWRHPSLAWLGGLVCSGSTLVIIAIPLTLHALRQLFAARSVYRDSKRARDLLYAGDLAGADTLWRICLERPDVPPYALFTTVHNLGVVALARGDLARARALIDHARASGWLNTLQLRRARPGVLQVHAVLDIAQGDLAAAAQALEQARDQATTASAAVQVAQVLLLARQGEYAKASALGFLLRQGREAGLPAGTIRLVRLVAAFAAERAGEQPEAVAEAWAAVEDPVAALPAWSAHWPELEAAARARAAGESG